MSEQSLQSTFSVDGPPRIHRYSVLLVVFAASLFFEQLVYSNLGMALTWLDTVLGTEIAGAIVYTGIIVGVLTACFVLVRQLRPDAADVEPETLVTLGGATTMLTLVLTHQMHASMDLPLDPGGSLTSFLVAVWMVLLGIGYARHIGLQLDLTPPDDETLVVVAGTAGAVVFVASVWIGFQMLFTTPRFSGTIVTGPNASPSVVEILVTVLFPALCSGVGTGILYFGAFQQTLGWNSNPATGVAGLTALVGTSSLAAGFVPLPLLPETLQLVGGPLVVAVAAVVSLLAAVAAIKAVDWVEDDTEIEVPPAAGIALGALTLVPFVVLGIAVGAPIAFHLSILLLALSTGIAAVGYEKTQSLWVPVVGMVSYYFLWSPAVVNLVTAGL